MTRGDAAALSAQGVGRMQFAVEDVDCGVQYIVCLMLPGLGFSNSSRRGSLDKEMSQTGRC